MPNLFPINKRVQRPAPRAALLALALFVLLAGVCAGVLYLELGLLRVLPGKNGLDIPQTPNARALTPGAFGAWAREEGESTAGERSSKNPTLNVDVPATDAPKKPAP